MTTDFTLSLIVAMTRNRVIGLDGDLPWHLPEDLKFFQRKTLHCPVIMGRKTYDSVGEPLPKRTNIVLSRSARDTPGVHWVRTLDEALEVAAEATWPPQREPECFIAGGSDIYALAMPRADRAYITEIDADLEGDTFFPMLDANWQEVASEPFPADERHAYPFTIRTLRAVRA